MNRDQVVSLLTSTKAQKYIDQVESFVKSLPHLPRVIIDVLVQVTPWLVVISGVLSAINGIQYVLFSLGIRQLSVITGISPAYWFILGVQQLVAAYLAFLAFQLLREKKYTGWVLLFWIMVTAAVASIATIIFIPGALLPSVLSVLIGAYLTFEIKNNYSDEGAVRVKVPASTTTATKKVPTKSKTKTKSKK